MTKWWRDNFAVPIEGGEDCLECGRPMQRAALQPGLAARLFLIFSI
jgi:hypothetical protein